MKPLPLPEITEVTLSHVALLVAVHEHPVWVVTSTEPLPPFPARVVAVWLRVSRSRSRSRNRKNLNNEASVIQLNGPGRYWLRQG